MFVSVQRIIANVSGSILLALKWLSHIYKYTLVRQRIFHINSFICTTHLRLNMNIKCLFLFNELLGTSLALNLLSHIYKYTLVRQRILHYAQIGYTIHRLSMRCICRAVTSDKTNIFLGKDTEMQRAPYTHHTYRFTYIVMYTFGKERNQYCHPFFHPLF